MPRVDSLFVHPIKSLDPESVERAPFASSGALRDDRRYAIRDEDGNYVNGKREPAVHRLRSVFDRETRTVRLREQGADDARAFSLDAERGALNAWLSDFFEYPVSVVRDDTGMPDDTDAHGPTVISTGTLEAVAEWFDLPTENVRRRFRPNVVLEAPAFWEDRLYADREHVVAFSVGDVTLEGVNPCQRCVVPTRDPDTGDETEGFQRRFVEQREATLPEWVDRDWYDHFYRLMVNTRVPATDGAVSVGDEVDVLETRDR